MPLSDYDHEIIDELVLKMKNNTATVDDLEKIINMTHTALRELRDMIKTETIYQSFDT
jgi:predicted transcriptional regulator